VESVRSKTAAGAEHIIVPPYLELIVFDIFRAPSNATVEVYAPGSSEPLRNGDRGVEAVPLGNFLETLAVARPQPGEWIVRKSHPDAHVHVRSQHFFPRGVLLEPALAPARSRIRIAYQVLDAADQPLEELRGYPLSLDVILAAPDGRKQAIPMERDSSLGRAAFRTVRDAECVAAGRYWTDVRVTAEDAAGRRLEIFRDRWSGFDAIAGAPLEASAAAAPRMTKKPPRIPAWLVAGVAAASIAAAIAMRFRKT
jgi:hypothetical protein